MPERVKERYEKEEDIRQEFENVYLFLSPRVVIANRIPTANDLVEIGGLWFNRNNNTLYFRGPVQTGWRSISTSAV